LVSTEKADELKMKYPAIPLFAEPDGNVKVSIAWILDKVLHLNGARCGAVEQFEHQPLVLINRGGATTSDIKLCASLIKTKVYEETGIQLEPEVRFVNEQNEP